MADTYRYETSFERPDGTEVDCVVVYWFYPGEAPSRTSDGSDDKVEIDTVLVKDATGNLVPDDDGIAWADDNDDLNERLINAAVDGDADLAAEAEDRANDAWEAQMKGYD